MPVIAGCRAGTNSILITSPIFVLQDITWDMGACLIGSLWKCSTLLSPDWEMRNWAPGFITCAKTATRVKCPPKMMMSNNQEPQMWSEFLLAALYTERVSSCSQVFPSREVNNRMHPVETRTSTNMENLWLFQFLACSCVWMIIVHSKTSDHSGTHYDASPNLKTLWKALMMNLVACIHCFSLILGFLWKFHLFLCAESHVLCPLLSLALWYHIH